MNTLGGYGAYSSALFELIHYCFSEVTAELLKTRVAVIFGILLIVVAALWASSSLATPDAYTELAAAAEETPQDESRAELQDELKLSANTVPNLIKHAVSSGDTVGSIAVEHGTDVETIVSLNNMSSPDRLRLGQELKVLTVRGILHTVTRGDTLSGIAKQYSVSVATVLSANPEIDVVTLRIGAEVIVPGGKTVSKPAVSQNSLTGGAVSTRTIQSGAATGFRWPLRGTITSGFGPRWGTLHTGLDIAAPEGTPVKASFAGTVTFAGWASGYGYLVKVSHAGGYETRYAHNSKIPVSPGDKVMEGNIIAYSGNTGNSTGPHLHFEIRINGKAIDPRPMLQ